jgi:5-methylcytosine-specific restriction protein B
MSFDWIPFYEELASKLLNWKNRQGELIQFLGEMRNKNLPVAPLNDQNADGNTFLLTEIDPFTFFATFNRSITDQNRKKIIGLIKEKFKVDAELPSAFEGIPLANNLTTWFFAYSHIRRPDDITHLWTVFEEALKESPVSSVAFSDAFNNALTVQQTSWNLTMGLFWIRPKIFLNLDGTMRNYLTTQFQITVPNANAFSASVYFNIIEQLKAHTDTSFPELSHLAYGGVLLPPLPPGVTNPVVYDLQDMINEGVFLEKPEIEKIILRLQTKKNLILQGAPGVGKTFVAKKLAYAFIGEKDDSRITAVQFHPSYSYEDFVRGYRPTDEAGKFELMDGSFWEFCDRARKDENRNYVMLIDEVNRGNLSQIFGELFMLLEADKRGESVTPLYRHKNRPEEKFSVPKNVYLIGTMNIADRSLALVDYALRRRFAFVTLEPKFESENFKKWLVAQNGCAENLCTKIISRMSELNNMIRDDRQLGSAYRIGHSFFCHKPYDGCSPEWFDAIIETEIMPLLKEYWHDEPGKLDDAELLLG